VRTGEDGIYTAELPPGASRLVQAGYRARANDREPAAVARAQLAVTAGVSFTADHRRRRLGQSVRFRGRVLGGPLPSGGVPIRIEAYDKGIGSWRPIRRPRTDREGRFTATWRFLSTVRTFTYKFRAFADTTAGWSFDPGASRSVPVTVVVGRRR